MLIETANDVSLRAGSCWRSKKALLARAEDLVSSLRDYYWLKLRTV
jgi:hypothetical protein